MTDAYVMLNCELGAEVMDILETDLVPSSVLCIGYPEQTKFPKPRRNLKDLVHVAW